MKYLPSFVVSLMLFGIWSCSDIGDPISCTEELDCAGECGGAIENDECGVCGGNGSTCNIRYATQILPMLEVCTGCHGSRGGLSLTSYTNLMIGGNSGAVVIPNNGSESLLVKKLLGTISGDRMPQNGPYFQDATINLIVTWIDEGALDN